MVTAVIDEKETTLYINNRKLVSNVSRYKLSEILGTNGIFYIGKANWANGEYFTGILDDYAVYDYAMTGEQVKEKYIAEADLDAEEEIKKAVSALHIPQGKEKATGNIMLPKESKNGVKFEWTSSNEKVISTKSEPCAFYYNEVDIPAGIVNRQKEDTVVKLKVKASYKQTQKEYSFDVTVKAANDQKEEYAGYL